MDREWTAGRVGERLIADFRSMQGGSFIFSAGGVTGRTVIDATTCCLGQHSIERKQLLSWANCQAKIGAASFSETCRENGWPRATAERNIERARHTVAEFMNARAAWEREWLAGLTVRKPADDA